MQTLSDPIFQLSFVKLINGKDENSLMMGNKNHVQPWD